jgi:hypothetical protein
MRYITEGYFRTRRCPARKIAPNNLKLGAITNRIGRILTIKCQTTKVAQNQMRRATFAKNQAQLDVIKVPFKQSR